MQGYVALADHLRLQKTVDDLAFQVAESHRRIANLLTPGTVKSFDPQKGAVVDVGFETHQIEHGMHSGTGKDWQPLKEGQKVTVLCPSGDFSNAFIIPGGFHDQNPAPSQSAGEDIRGQRGTDDKPVRLITTDTSSTLDNQAKQTSVTAGDGIASLTNAGKKTSVNAGDKVAELVNDGEKSFVRARKSGCVTCEVTDQQKFLIVVGQGSSQKAYYIDPSVLRETSIPS